MEQKHAFDGAIRRRIYLLRHGDVSYVDEKGQHVPDSRVVPLTPYGHEQAAGMGKMLANIEFDKAACSGLLRTRQTAEGILASREMVIEDIPAFHEIGSNVPRDPNFVIEPFDAAYGFCRAAEPDAAYMGREKFQDFYDRVADGMEALAQRTDWQQLLLVCHGGTNRAALCWALNTGLQSFATFEQDTCCVNILDIDTDPDTGKLRRKFIRAVNVTAYDPAKANRHFTTLEDVGKRVQIQLAQSRKE